MEQLLAERQGVFDAIYHRRAVRAYSREQPRDETLRTLLEAAVHAPTAMHAEPWAFAIVQDRERLKRYSDRAKSMMLAGTHEQLDLFPGRPASQDLTAMLADPGFNIFYDAGTLIVICRQSGGPFSEADCWLAAENLMLAAYAESLGTCCIGFAVQVLNEPDVMRELGIPEGVVPVVPIIVGIPRSEPAPVSRRPAKILGWIR